MFTGFPAETKTLVKNPYVINNQKENITETKKEKSAPIEEDPLNYYLSEDDERLEKPSQTQQKSFGRNQKLGIKRKLNFDSSLKENQADDSDIKRKKNNNNNINIHKELCAKESVLKSDENLLENNTVSKNIQINNNYNNVNVRKRNNLSLRRIGQKSVPEKRSKMYDYRHQSQINKAEANASNIPAIQKGEDDDGENNGYQQKPSNFNGAINSIATLCNIGKLMIFL
jgi:hypothetical protein